MYILHVIIILFTSKFLLKPVVLVTTFNSCFDYILSGPDRATILIKVNGCKLSLSR